VDPRAYAWRCPEWRGRPWHEAVIYELHTGTFTPAGTFDGVAERLDYLKDLGVTAIELMPVAHFGGARGWGYDGVYLYAPHPAYGGVEGLKRLVDAAHAKGLMVLLDVVYNHFGPEGNYIPSWLPQFFHPDVHTPWGPAIAYDEKPVRDFMIDNALYWLEEYRLDGLRLDAIDAIRDTTDTPLVEELAARVRERISDRHVHLTTEDDRNIAWHIERAADGSVPLVTAEWNDDFHHTAHVLATGEQYGYYEDYETGSAAQMARALATGFVYQGERSRHRGECIGSASAHLPPGAFVHFLQNHDQVGNRAFGERLRYLAPSPACDCLQAILLLSPQVPLLFQGEEFGDTNPFCYFTDFDGELGAAVSQGRRDEFRHFPAYRFAAEAFPDPNDEATFLASKLDWNELARPVQQRCLELTQKALSVRREVLMPLLAQVRAGADAYVEGRAFAVAWRFGQGGNSGNGGERYYHLFANVSDKGFAAPAAFDRTGIGRARPVRAGDEPVLAALAEGTLAAWTAVFCLAEAPLFTPNAAFAPDAEEAQDDPFEQGGQAAPADA
ncbi:MAG TPA: malto-oligosyltrehalose trehalohydrolase, partial [Woeseiaceae bacterium]|nr:malto-oligosyltrehalose trehalohydrolase [Woeseiaceae bacterium]